MKNNYTVSVRLMTYMHEDFIKDAMDGIMMQKTDFKVELVVGDDFSTDGTLDLIRKYKDTENIHIKILEREKGDIYWQKRQELGRLYNFTNILDNCSGKYIALLDGDDYWTDPLKLQKQVDFLEENEEYALCFTNCSTVNNLGQIKNPKFINYDKDRIFSIEDLMFVAPTVTRVLRKEAMKFSPSFYETNEAPGDAKMLINLLHQGKAKYLNFFSGCYRKHGGGVWSHADKVLIRKSKFEIAYYGLVVTNQENKFIFFREALLELSKLLRHGRKNHRLKLNKFIKGYKKYIDLNASRLFYFRLYLFFLKIPFLPNSIIARIQLRIIKERFQKHNSI